MVLAIWVYFVMAVRHRQMHGRNLFLWLPKDTKIYETAGLFILAKR